MTNATQLAVFYATQSKILRRKIIPDDDAKLMNFRVLPGESMILLPLTPPPDDAHCRDAIATLTGVNPPSGRCCIVDHSGYVFSICNADPALDTHPQGHPVESETAQVGDRHLNGLFFRQYQPPTISDAITSVS